MTAPKPWRVTESACLFEHPFVRITQDTLIHPIDGRQFEYTYLGGKDHPVAVVAVTKTGSIVLTRQYRHPVGKIILDLPAGRPEPTEIPIDAARRELQEETGYIAGHIEPLGFFNQFPGSMQIGTYLFFAAELRPGPQNLDPNEDIEVVELSVADTLNLITQNKTIDGALMLGVLLAQAKGLLTC